MGILRSFIVLQEVFAKESCRFHQFDHHKRNYIIKLIKLILTATLFTIITSCASMQPQTPIEFANPKLMNNFSVTIVMTEVPSPSMWYPGADCLLCLGVAATANTTLSSHVKTLLNDDLNILGLDVEKLLSAKGLKVKFSDISFDKKKLNRVRSEIPNTARKDFTLLKDQYNTSHLLVIDFYRVGISRNYLQYIPKGEPYSDIAGTAYMVNLETNIYDWYLPFSENKNADGEWKEPKDFPTLSKAYYESLEQVREKVLSSLEEI